MYPVSNQLRTDYIFAMWQSVLKLLHHVFQIEYYYIRVKLNVNNDPFVLCVKSAERLQKSIHDRHRLHFILNLIYKSRSIFRWRSEKKRSYYIVHKEFN